MKTGAAIESTSHATQGQNGARDRRRLVRRLAGALLLAALVLAVCHQAYWRPFDDEGQESVASFHAFGMAAANAAALWPNPVVAHDIDVEHSRVRPYNHWPNGFFLLLEGVLRVFGRTERVGRSVAILCTLLGFTLVVVSLKPDGPLLYASIPLIVMSGVGRDAIPFVFIDAAMYAWIGILLWIATREARTGRNNLAFRIAMLAALLFNHLIVPYAAAIILLKWRETRSARDMVIDFACLAGGGAALLLALAAGYGNVANGAAELRRMYAIRSTSPNLFPTLAWELRRSLYLGPKTWWIVAGAWAVVAAARQWRTAILLPSFLVFALVLKEYVAGHHFTRLPLIFFSLLTLLASAEIVFKRLEALGKPGWLWQAARVGVVLVLALRLGRAPQEYTTDYRVQATRNALFRIVERPEYAAQLKDCGAFGFIQSGHKADPNDRIGQFFFGKQVAERVKRGHAVRTCWVDLDAETVKSDQ